MSTPRHRIENSVQQKDLHSKSNPVESSRNASWDRFNDQQRAEISVLLLSFGVPIKLQPEYINDLQGMIEFALDCYFSELRDAHISKKL